MEEIQGGMESDVLARFRSFSLSTKETQGVELGENDVTVGMNEAGRSLIGKVLTNFVGMRSAMMKLWHHRGLCKVVALEPNVYQFVFNSATERKGIPQGRLWFFDNQLLVLYTWKEGMNGSMDCFNI